MAASVVARVAGHPGPHNFGDSGDRPAVERDRGAVAVEAAIVLPLLLTVVLATVQLGALVHTHVGVASAARAGARTASAEQSGGDFANEAVRAVAASGVGVAPADIAEIWVYQANQSGFPGTAGQTSFPAQCPQQCVRFTVDGSGQPTPLEGVWLPVGVDRCLGTAHHVGVRVVARHQSLAAAIPGPTLVSGHAVMRFEPGMSGSCR